MLAYLAHLHTFGFTFRCAKKNRHEDTIVAAIDWAGYGYRFRIEVVIQRLLGRVELVTHALPEFLEFTPAGVVCVDNEILEIHSRILKFSSLWRCSRQQATFVQTNRVIIRTDFGLEDRR